MIILVDFGVSKAGVCVGKELGGQHGEQGVYNDVWDQLQMQDGHKDVCARVIITMN